MESKNNTLLIPKACRRGGSFVLSISFVPQKPLPEVKASHMGTRERKLSKLNIVILTCLK